MAEEVTALLVLDCQNYYAPLLGKILPNIERLIRHFRLQRQPIIFFQHGHSRDELSQTPSPSPLVRKIGADYCIERGSEEWRFHVNIKKLVDETGHDQTVIQKNTYDGFIGTELDAILKQKRAARVVVMGVLSNVACDTTARSASSRGYEAWLVGDACAAADKTQHEAAMKVFDSAFGDVVQVKDLTIRW